MGRYYITTSIAYANSEPHIGFLMELISADVLARFHQKCGDEVFFQTGTDEHGSKISQAAAASGLSPQKFVDEKSAKFRALITDFNLIKTVNFIRTTDDKHQQYVKKCWQKIADKGLLEKRKYTGQYCSGCEAFKTESEIVDGKCAIHQQQLENIEEENYFFKLSQFQLPILKWLKEVKPIKPDGRLNEVISFVERGLDDISFSRSKDKLTWGIPVPDDDSQVMYVWMDALLNYLSGLESCGKKISEWWPGVNVVGKDILRFHAVIWPAMLMALGYPLPKELIAHGFIQVNGQKMSKSLGNVVTPEQLIKRYGAEATRYLILRQLNYYEDGDFVWKDVDALYNGELANGLGNLVARTVKLLNNFGVKGLNLNSEYRVDESLLNNDDFSGELKEINDLIGYANQWISDNQPWKWNAEASDIKTKAQRLIDETRLVIIAAKLEPFMPETSAKILKQLLTGESEVLFPRISL